jgi:hypothetical protein
MLRVSLFILIFGIHALQPAEASPLRLVCVHDGKLIVWDGDKIQPLEPNPELLDKFNVTPEQIQASTNRAGSTETLQAKVESWLVRLRTAARQPQKATPIIQRPKETETLAPATQTPAATNIHSFTSGALHKNYKPETYDNKFISVSGLVTRIIDNKNGEFIIIMDDWIRHVHRGGGNVKTRDTSGNPKAVADWVVGRSGTISGVSLGLTPDGYLVID